MALMPRGEPRTVPDPAGDLYDAEMERQRAKRAAIEGAPGQRWAGSPARLEAQDAMAAAPVDPKGLRYLPITGPLVDAYDHFRDGRVLRGAGDIALAVGDGLLVATGAGVAAAFERGTAKNVGRMTAEAARKQLRRRGVAGPGQEIHHSIELNGISRTVENWRNHPAFLKVLSTADHRRLRGSWGDLPKFGPVQRLWVGTPAWMKNVPAGLTARATDALGRRIDPQKPPPPTR